MISFLQCDPTWRALLELLLDITSYILAAYRYDTKGRTWQFCDQLHLLSPHKASVCRQPAMVEVNKRKANTDSHAKSPILATVTVVDQQRPKRLVAGIPCRTSCYFPVCMPVLCNQRHNNVNNVHVRYKMFPFQS